MTPKEKAKELLDKYKFYLGNEKENINEAKDLALIAVDEVMHHAENAYYNKDIIIGAKLYLEEVKQEIEKL